MTPPAPPLPPWVARLFRFGASLAIIFIGVKGWADGYGGALVTVGTSMIVIELTDLGLSRSQASAIPDYIATLERQLVGPPGSSTPSTNPPVQ